MLISVLFLFVNANFTYAGEVSPQKNKYNSVTVVKAEQNQVPIFKKAKTKIKKWFKTKKEQVKKIIPWNIKKKQGNGLALTLVILGMIIFLAGILPMLLISPLGIIDIIVFFSISMVGIILWLIGLLHKQNISKGNTK